MRLTLRLLILGALIAGLFPLTMISAQDDLPLLKIGDVQGVIPDDMTDANAFDAPLRGDRVRVSGVVTNPIAINASGRISYGFFLQETPENSDGDPNTSDGVQVVTGVNLAIDDYVVAVGDIITIEAEVEEYYDFTRLRQAKFVSLDGHVEDVDEAVPPIELNPQGTPEEIYRYYERIEGMRVSVPAGSVVVAPTHLFSSTNDTEVYVVRPDHPIAQREDIFARRVFRDVHPLDDGQPGENLYRISVEANVLKALAQDYEVNLPIYNTFEVFDTPLAGNIIYAFGRYTLQIDALPEVEATVLPIENNNLVAPDRSSQFTVATLNVENFYDYYNDPFDREDTPDDLRLNYVPRSLADYEARIEKVAQQIVGPLHAPDIIGFQEIEDQDVCVDGGQLYGTCSDETDNADNYPDTLHDVAISVENLTEGEIVYVPAIDRDSADDRGIAQAFLYRADRVELVPPTEDHPIFGLRPDDEAGRRYELNYEVSNPKALNESFGVGLATFARPPLVALFRVHRDAVGSDDYVEIYFANNHFKSDPTGYEALREGQARYNLGFVEAVQQLDPDAYFIVGGDLNSFAESSEMAVLGESLVNVSRDVPPEANYSYIFAGQAQTLDYLFVTPSLAKIMSVANIVHVNADYGFQYELDGTSAFRAGDHDPVIATFNFPE